MEIQKASEFLFPQMGRPHMVIMAVGSQDKTDFSRIHPCFLHIFLYLFIALRRTAVDEEPSVFAFHQIHGCVKEMSQAGAAYLIDIC